MGKWEYDTVVKYDTLTLEVLDDEFGQEGWQLCAAYTTHAILIQSSIRIILSANCANNLFFIFNVVCF